jgi:hypothetical protein
MLYDRAWGKKFDLVNHAIWLALLTGGGFLFTHVRRARVRNLDINRTNVSLHVCRIQFALDSSDLRAEFDARFKRRICIHLKDDSMKDDFDLAARRTKSITTAKKSKKSMLKLVKLQSLAAKCCKIRKM